MRTLPFFAAFCCAAALSCTTQQPISSRKAANNETYTVQYLFEHEGCRVYRFIDGGNRVYFTNCNGDTASFPDSSTVIYNRGKTVKKRTGG